MQIDHLQMERDKMFHELEYIQETPLPKNEVYQLELTESEGHRSMEIDSGKNKL